MLYSWLYNTLFYMYVKILTQKKFHVYMWVLQFHVFLLFFLGGDGIFRNDSYDFNNRIIFCFWLSFRITNFFLFPGFPSSPTTNAFTNNSSTNSTTVFPSFPATPRFALKFNKRWMIWYGCPRRMLFEMSSHPSSLGSLCTHRNHRNKYIAVQTYFIRLPTRKEDWVAQCIAQMKQIPKK